MSRMENLHNLKVNIGDVKNKKGCVAIYKGDIYDVIYI